MLQPSPRRPRHTAASALVCVLMLAAATPVGADEVICDPENPACVIEPDGAQELPGAGEETICDPENPACQPEDSTASTLVTEPAGDLRSEGSESSGAFQNAQFLGGWSTRLDVDTGFEGENEDIVELSSGLDLGLEWDPTNSFRVVLNGNFRHWVAGKQNPDETDLLLNAAQPRAAYHARLGEAYALWRSGIFSIALGNQVVRWGSTDLTRPGDVINPTDQSSISALAAPERIPQLTLDATWAGDGWSVQGLVVPFFVPDRRWAFGRDTALLTSRNPVVRDQFPIESLVGGLIDDSVVEEIQPLANATREPDEVPANVSVGARASATFWNTDVAIGWWRGFDRTPFIFADEDLRALLQTITEDGQVLEDLDFLQFVVRNRDVLEVTDRISEKAAAGEDLFYSEHRRMQMLLIDGARYIGPIGVRVDAAFFPRRTYLTESFSSVRRPTVSTALGLSWERIQDENDALTVTLEGFWNRPLPADSAVTESLVPENLRGSEDDPLMIVGDGIYGVSGGVAWMIPWIESRLQLGGVYNVSHGDVIATAAFSRQFFDWLSVSVGYTAFEGPAPEDRLTLGGIYDANDHVSIGFSGVF